MAAPRRDRAGASSAANPFVGRESELERITDLLFGSARLITLVGPGGIGKTRLAAEATRRLQHVTGTSVHWVRLARLAKGAGADAVAEEVARSIVDVEFSGRPARRVLIDTFMPSGPTAGSSLSLLVLDNCEHVLVGAGELIADLLDAVPNLSVLATSRAALGWVEERLVVVPPLSQQQALTLFQQRAEFIGRPVSGADELVLAMRICRHVHNHPLYIRLAAARLMQQPIAAIMGELSGANDDRRMQWSHGPRVGEDARHQRIGDVIAWSYALCEDEERLLFDRMSVFAAGYEENPEDTAGKGALDVGVELEAIEEICADNKIPLEDSAGAYLPKNEISDLVERLVDHSLVSVHITQTTVRYSLLESLRLFAAERLRERSHDGVDEGARLAARHRRYYRDKVAGAYSTWFSPAEHDVLSRTRSSWDNIVDAIEGSLITPRDAVVGLEIVTTLLALGMPLFRGSLRQARRLAELTLRAVQSLDQIPTGLCVRAMALIAWITFLQGEHDDAELMLEACVRASLPDAASRRTWRNDPGKDIGLPAAAEFAWGAELMLVHRDPRSVVVLGRAREKLGRNGNRGGAAMTEMLEAEAAGFLGTPEQAIEIARRNLESFTIAGVRWARAWAQIVWAIALTKHGNPEEALAVGRTALQHQYETRDKWGASWVIHVRMWSLAHIIVSRADAHEAQRRAPAVEIARLAGATGNLRAALGTDLDGLGPFADETYAAIEIARQTLGAESFATAAAQGATLRADLGEVERFALGTLSLGQLPGNHPARGGNKKYWSELTSAEEDVALLAAAGWTNPMIAARRGNSFKTVDAQMAAIFQKLMISSRRDIIKCIPEDRLGVVETEAAQRPRRRANRGPQLNR